MPADDLVARLREWAEHVGEHCEDADPQKLANDLRLACIHFEAADREIRHLSDAKDHIDAERAATIKDSQKAVEFHREMAARFAGEPRSSSSQVSLTG